MVVATRLARSLSLASATRPTPAAGPFSASRLSFSTTRSPCAPTPDGDNQEGSIADVFSSLGGDAFVPLEPRFASLKQSLWHDGLIESWRSVLSALEERTAEIVERGNKVIPQVPYRDIKDGVPHSLAEEIKRVGTVVVHDAVELGEAERWKRELEAYIKRNRDLAKGFPADDPQVWELYNSVQQTQARTHPGVLGTQKALLSLFHTSSPDSPVSVKTPISYYDRLRIRFPGDAIFALGEHIDGGSLERWEDPGFRSCWREILAGGPEPHERHDPWDLSPRLDAKTSLYPSSGQCSVFRMFQGWTALSNTAPGEGTLRVFPDVSLATAYLVLRPLFRPRRGREGKLGFDDWEVDVESTDFPGSVKGKGQELSDKTHPHLRLPETMTSVPRVKPGSSVWWHCDVIHSVESQHLGAEDSSVFYIPAVPLTVPNAHYLAAQRARFAAGTPAPDFPGGEGERRFEGRATVRDTHEGSGSAGRRAIGAERFVVEEGETPGGRRVVEEANRILGFS
ncbi:hypothetical protein JCM3775_006539 [Rhodotorula graminis]